MKERQKAFWDRNKELLECMGICFLVSFLTIIYFIIDGNGVFVVRADFNTQNIPFTTALHHAIADGGINSFCWNLDLGTSTVEGYAFYNLGSPFFWLSMLFPAKSYPYVVGWMYMLKYTVAGALAFVYFKRFVRTPKLAVLGGVLYAFSGFSATNLVYHFHDVIALFPLILIGIELYMENKKKKGYFIAAVALNALVNYFFFVQSVVFLCIYFLVRFWKKEWKENFKNIGGCLLCGILGVGFAAPIFLTGIMHILLGQNQNGSCIYISSLLSDSVSCLATLKAFFFPAEIQNSCSALEVANFSSTAAYLPMVGVTFVIAYIRKHKDWLSRLLIILFVMSFSPLLSSAFLLFTGFYHRWWIAMVMMMALATILVLDRAKDYKIMSSAVINGIMVVCMWAIVTFIPWSEGYDPLVFHPLRFQIYTLIALSGVILCMIGTAKFNLNYRYMICGVSVFSILTTGFVIYLNQSGYESGTQYLERFMAGAGLEVYDEQYRYTSTDNLMALPGEGAGMGCYTSTRSNAIKKLDSYFDFETDVLSLDKTSIRGLSELLGGKYYISVSPTKKTALQNFEIEGITYYVYERDACPIGFAVSGIITEEELLKIPVQDRGIALLAAALIPQDAEETVSDALPRLTADTIDFEKSVADYVAHNAAQAVDHFERNAKKFSCVAAYNEERYVYFSVPYTNDWTLYIDGKESEIISSAGMMLVHVPAGEHTLEFRYGAPYYKIGCIAALISLLIVLAGSIWNKRKEIRAAAGSPQIFL